MIEMEPRVAHDCDDRSLWSTLGYDALGVIWGIETDALAERQKRTLTAATIELRDRRPDALGSLQDEILAVAPEQRVSILLRRLS